MISPSISSTKHILNNNGSVHVTRNLQTSLSEFSTVQCCHRWPGLRELELSNRQFTWANSREVPTFEKLDRILVSTELEQKYPLSTVQALTREISDHTPLLLNTGNGTHHVIQTLFKFEFGWILRDGFREKV